MELLHFAGRALAAAAVDTRRASDYFYRGEIESRVIEFLAVRTKSDRCPVAETKMSILA